MNKDRILTLGQGSKIQIGPLNRRIYLMKLDPRDCLSIIPELEKLAQSENLTKIFIKIPASSWPPFLAAGYEIEGYVPGLFKREEDGLFAARYLDPLRKAVDKEEILFIQDLLQKRPGKVRTASGLPVRECGREDIPLMAEFYSHIFCRYPFPINDPAFIARGMDEGTLFFGVWDKGRPLALGSAEQDFESLSAEMTDFGVDPRGRGLGLASVLLEVMEKAVRAGGIKTAFTIARLKSPGMNKTFFNASYRYSGTLVNNTYMGTEESSSPLESMNIWYKPL